jgi:hypothetical protein
MIWGKIAPSIEFSGQAIWTSKSPTLSEMGPRIRPMDLSQFTNLPAATLSSAILYQLLGPTATYLGGKASVYTEAMVSNVERMFSEAHKKLPPGQRATGEVPPRLLYTSLEQGAFTENGLASSYLGGVLASSKCEDNSDDRGVAINHTIAGLSVYAIRMHYLLYKAFHECFQGVPWSTVMFNYQPMHMSYGHVAVYVGMGFHEFDEDKMETDAWSLVGHALRALHREELVNWVETPEQSNRYEFVPTHSGIELFLWANGCGKKDLDYFFHKEFTPHEFAGDDVIFISGKSVTVAHEPPEAPIIIDGFYALPRSPKDYVCPVALEQNNR